MEKYERQIGLKTIYLTFVRRWSYILIIFLPILLASYIITQHVMKKTYASTATISKNAVFDQTRYDGLKSYINSSMESTVEALVNVKHKDGSSITMADLSTISVGAFVANRYEVIVTFSSRDSSITKIVLTELCNQTVDKFYNHDEEGNRTTIRNEYYTGLDLKGGSASGPSVSSGNNKYFIIGCAAGAVLALALPFVYEIASDEIYEASDLTNYGIPAFDIKASTRSSKKKNLTVEI